MSWAGKSHKKKWNSGTVQVHVDTPPIPLIISNKNDRSDKYFYEIKLGRDLTSEKLDLYEFKMALFNNGYPKQFLLFIWNFNMTIEVSRTNKSSENIQYLRTLVHVEVLRQFDMLSAEVGSATP